MSRSSAASSRSDSASQAIAPDRAVPAAAGAAKRWRRRARICSQVCGGGGRRLPLVLRLYSDRLSNFELFIPTNDVLHGEPRHALDSFGSPQRLAPKPRRVSTSGDGRFRGVSLSGTQGERSHTLRLFRSKGLMATPIVGIQR